MSTKTKTPVRSGELARMLAISPDTLRLYERKGLLPRPPRSSNGYRCYAPAAVDRIRLIRAALSIGFTLTELAEVLAMRDGEAVPCAHVRALAGTKLESLDLQIRQLGELRAQLAVILKQWDSALKKAPRGQRAGLLERLAADPGSQPRRLSPQLYSSLAGKSIHTKPVAQGIKPIKKKSMLDLLLIVALLMTATAPLRSQQLDTTPAPQSHSQTASQESCQHSMDTGRADGGMGFSQAKTRHHFILAKDGGEISVETKDAKDTASRDQIRMHLSHIARMFADGNFDIPMFVHNQVPPGIAVMQSRKDQIQYRFEETRQGGRVVMTSSDPEAVSALHEFLSFQIREHKTGDNPAVR
jgi:DNA-binding transcriptional MerR regulator